MGKVFWFEVGGGGMFYCLGLRWLGYRLGEGKGNKGKDGFLKDFDGRKDGIWIECLNENVIGFVNWIYSIWFFYKFGEVNVISKWIENEE